MSFQFPKPVPESRNPSYDSDSDSDSDFDSDFDHLYHDPLMRKAGPDYDELIIPLSLFAFNRLSPSDQWEQVEEIRCIVESEDVEEQLPEESDEAFRKRSFSELFKKLPYSDQLGIFLSKVLQKFKEETSNNENISDWKSCFSEFFFGFSVIWFQGQAASGQDLMLEQLSLGIGGSVESHNRLQDESEEDFKLRRFTELCKQVVDFRVQLKFLDNAEEKLKCWGKDHFRFRSVLEPQEHDRAAELLSHLSTLGFSLLSAKYQQHKIDEMSYQVESAVKSKRLLAADELQTSTTDPEEAIRMRRFRELFNQAPVHNQIYLFEEMRRVLLKQKSYSEAVHFFSGLGSEDQTEMIVKLRHEIRDSADLVIEKLSGESEEEFRLRRFTKVCTKHLSTRDYIALPVADMRLVRQGTSDYEEESLYAKFLFDVSVTWFKARCANYRRNPLHVILFGQVEFRDVIEKLPEESEEDFRLRRFTESFKRLEYPCKVIVVDYIQDTLFGDLGHPVSYRIGPRAPKRPSDGRSLFDIEWCNVKLSKLQGQTAAETTRGVSAAAGTGATTQAGGRGVGMTSQ